MSASVHPQHVPTRDPRFCHDYSEFDEYDIDPEATIAPRFPKLAHLMLDKASGKSSGGKVLRKVKNAEAKAQSALRRAARAKLHEQAAANQRAAQNPSDSASTDSAVAPSAPSAPTASPVDSSAESKGHSHMRTSEEVFNRLRWDADAQYKWNPEHIMIGYLDRFDGMQETPFNKFRSWGDIYSDKYFVPFHRVWYFRYFDTMIWDRKHKVDLVFAPAAIASASASTDSQSQASDYGLSSQ